MNRWFQYIEHDKTVGLAGYYGSGTAAQVPDRLDGKPVDRLEAYAFAVSRPEFTDRIKSCREETSLLAGGPEQLWGGKVTQIELPYSIERIGNYCFYGCSRLEKLCFTDHLSDIGGGAFTGCRLKELEIDFYDGEKSCLRDVAAENRYRLNVTLRYHRKNGKTETAKILFPEHYEEAVENTPARIVMTQYHGSGGNYRQCFYQKELDYREYDELFPHALAWEEQEVLLTLVFGRLLFPYRLSVQAQERYQAYLKDVSGEAVRMLVGKEDLKGLSYMAAQGIFNETSMETGITCAAETGKTEVLSFLMEKKNRLFPAKKKVFVW